MLKNIWFHRWHLHLFLQVMRQASSLIKPLALTTLAAWL